MKGVKMSKPNYTTDERVDLVYAFYSAIRATKRKKEVHTHRSITQQEYYDELAQTKSDLAWSAAAACGYVWTEDSNFVNWVQNDLNATDVEILICGLNNALDASKETS